MKTAKSTIVSLTGGLGNQLFQLAAGLKIAGEQPLSLEWGLGRPRTGIDGLPDLFTFDLPKNVSMQPSRENNWLASKATGFMLRMAIAPKSVERLPGFFLVSQIMASMVVSLYFRSPFTLLASRNVGYSPLRERALGKFLVGYFQSYKYSQDNSVSTILQGLSVREKCDELIRYWNLSLVEKPLVVHIRLGDYKSENDFGVLSESYYDFAIKKMWETGNFKKIWVFSDEPELARIQFSKNFAGELRWIPEINKSATKTLEVMRFGHGYVIGNSTFSWWGAFLSYTSGAKVIAPSPWFKNLPTPHLLIPPNWETINPW